MGKRSTTRRNRKIRRLTNARLRTGKRIITHKSRSGRTGKVRQAQRKGHKAELKRAA